jgi:hypothetical protein
MSEQAAKWRALAGEMLAAAAEMTDPHAKAVLIDLAARYQAMADWEDEPSTPDIVFCDWKPPKSS